MSEPRHTKRHTEQHRTVLVPVERLAELERAEQDADRLSLEKRKALVAYRRKGRDAALKAAGITGQQGGFSLKDWAEAAHRFVQMRTLRGTFVFWTPAAARFADELIVDAQEKSRLRRAGERHEHLSFMRSDGPDTRRVCPMDRDDALAATMSDMGTASMRSTWDALKPHLKASDGALLGKRPR